jgi:hypothetical protein
MTTDAAAPKDDLRAADAAELRQRLRLLECQVMSLDQESRLSQPVVLTGWVAEAMNLEEARNHHVRRQQVICHLVGKAFLNIVSGSYSEEESASLMAALVAFAREAKAIRDADQATENALTRTLIKRDEAAGLLPSLAVRMRERLDAHEMLNKDPALLRAMVDLQNAIALGKMPMPAVDASDAP